MPPSSSRTAPSNDAHSPSGAGAPPPPLKKRSLIAAASSSLLLHRVRPDADSIGKKKTKSQKQPPREEKRRKSDSPELRRGQCVRALLESARLSFHQSAAPYVRALERNARVLVGMRAELLRRGAVAAGSAALVHPHRAAPSA